MKFLLYGKGWIGQQTADLISAGGDQVEWGQARVDDTQSVRLELQTLKPDRVICLVGRTHGGSEYPNIDYLELPGKLVENLRDNLYAPVSLALLCQELGIHYTLMNTGCIFEYDDLHPIGGIGFTEEDLPNFTKSQYSTVKGITDRLLHQIPSCVLRLRMPITSDDSGRNFINKITAYKKIASMPNSMSVLPTLLPLMVDLSKRKYNGVLNFTNPGVISHNEILEMYRDIVDPDFQWENFTVAEQSEILRAGRSNNCLDTSRLAKLYPSLPNIKEAVRTVLVDMASRRGGAGSN